MVIDTVENPRDDEFVIRFHAEWCGPCKSFEPVYRAASEETTIPFYDVNVEEAPELAGQYKVRSIPAVFYRRIGDGTIPLQVKSSADEFNKQLG